MAWGLGMKQCFSILFACLAVLALFIMSGLGCVTLEQNHPTGHAWTATESEFESKSYITPECSPVVECLQSIIGVPPHEPTEEGFDAIRDWVAYNIEYEPDEDQVGQKDYWETPEEILNDPRAGDCEEFSILLCTLLRAYGIDAEHVYVVIGVDGNGGAHAFLMENWYQGGEWRAIEAQAPAKLRHGFPVFPIFDSGLDRYEIIVAFNDLYYYDGSFPWDEDQAKSGTLAEEATGVNNIVRLLSQSLDYLFRILFNENQHDVSCMNNITSILYTFPAFPAMLSD